MSLEINILSKSQLKGLDYNQLLQMYIKNYPFLTHLLDLKLSSIVTVCDEVRQSQKELMSTDSLTNHHIQPAYEYMDREFDKTQKITSHQITLNDDSDMNYLLEV